MERPVAVISHSNYLMARRRINIALATLEDGMFGLFTAEDVVHLLNAALADLDEAHVSEHGNGSEVQPQSSIDWNAWAFSEDA
jgi:hypothetical protein